MTKARTLADNFAADINSVTAGTGITGGGTSGTVTVTNSMATEIDAKGDLVVGTGADTFARLAVASTAGYLLAVDSTETTGLKWAAPASGGKVLQVVNAVITTPTTISTTSLTDSGITANITPSSATSKVLVLITYSLYRARNASEHNNGSKVLRGATTIADYSLSNWESSGANGSTSQVAYVVNSITLLDSPASTSALTYKFAAQLNNTLNSATIVFQNDNQPSNITLIEIGA